MLYNGMPLIELDRLNKTYRIVEKRAGLSGSVASLFAPRYRNVNAVRDLSFEINEGETVGFIGPNGAGKSTTIKMLTGILVPTSGRVRVAGFDPYRDRRRYVGMIGAVFGQRSQLWWDLPLADTFRLLRKVYDIPRPAFEANVATFDRILGLHEFQDRPVRQLSLGQRMRADIAAALLHDPRIVFFDEPTIGLDVVAKEEIREFLRTMNRERGVTMLFTTHDMSDIEKTCRRAIIIDKGGLIYDGSLDRIRSELGRERTVVAQFNSPPPPLDFPGVTVECENPLRYRLRFDRDGANIGELMRRLTTEYDIADLGIEETDIETIVRGIYRKGAPC